MLQQKTLKKTLIKNARRYVEVCARIFIVNNVKDSKKIIFVVCKNMKNKLLSIIDITIKVTIFRNYEKNTSFILRQSKKNKEKNKFLNKKYNEKIKCVNSYKRMQYNTNNSRLENKNRY